MGREAINKYKLRVVFWETTEACNLNCRHCRRERASHIAGPGELSTGEAREWIEGLAGWSHPLLILSGGEPLLRGDVLELAELAAGLGLRVALASNGTLIDRKTALRIRAAGVRRVSVSLDGCDAETHDRIRGADGAFGRAWNALGILKDSGLSTQINMTVCRDNVEKVAEIYNLAIESGVDAVHLFVFVPVGCGLELAKEQMLSPEEIEDFMRSYHERYSRMGVETRLTCAPQYQRFLGARGKVIRDKPSGCLGGRSVCFVSHRGDVYPCGYLPVRAGNLRDQDLREIWEGCEVFFKLRDPAELARPCGGCDYSVACGGCRARAYAENGDYLGADSSCILAEQTGQVVSPLKL